MKDYTLFMNSDKYNFVTGYQVIPHQENEPKKKKTKDVVVSYAKGSDMVIPQKGDTLSHINDLMAKQYELFSGNVKNFKLCKNAWIGEMIASTGLGVAGDVALCMNGADIKFVTALGVVSVGFTIGSDEIGIDAYIGMNEYASVNMGVSYSSRSKKVETTVGAGVHAGGAHLGAQYSSGNKVSARVGFGEDDRSIGMTVSSDGVNAYYSDRGTSIFAGSNGVGVSVAGTGLPIANSVAKGKSKESFAGLAIIVPTQIGVFSSGFSQSTNEYWLSSISSEYLYGYMYQSGPAIDVDRENELVGIPYVYQNALSTHNSYNIDWDFTKKGKTLEALGDNDMYPAYDIYSVSSEGLSGSFRPYARESHSLYKKISDRRTRTDNVESYSTILTEESKKNEEFVMFANEEFVLDANRNMVVSNEYPDYKKCNDGSGKPCSVYGEYETYYRNKGNRLVYNSKENEFEERSGMRFLFVGESNGYYESEPVGAGANRDTTKVSDLLLKRTLKKSNQDGNYDYNYAFHLYPLRHARRPLRHGERIHHGYPCKDLQDRPCRSGRFCEKGSSFHRISATRRVIALYGKRLR